jgi:hypothetical protein
VEDQPSNAVLNNNYATWLPFSATQPHAQHLMVLRNMLGDAFPNSVQNCAQGTDSTAIAECEVSMGAYYPQTATCPAATFKNGGTAPVSKSPDCTGTNRDLVARTPRPRTREQGMVSVGLPALGRSERAVPKSY